MDWDSERQCLVDYMGLPLTKTEVRELLEQCKRHLKRSEVQLASAANDVLAARYPEMLQQQYRHSEDMK